MPPGLSACYHAPVAGHQVVRMAKRSGVGGNLGKHIDGASRPPEAEPRQGLEPVVRLEGDRDLAQQAIDEGRQLRVRGRKPAPAVEFVIAGPPPYEGPPGSPPPWSPEKTRQWADDSVAWVKRHAGPDSVVAHSGLHQDERSPHVHVMIVPRDDQGRLGWNRIRAGFGITGKERGPQLMSAMQDSYQREVGAKYGLGRGERGSQRKHQQIDRRAGFLERALAGGFRGFGKTQLQQVVELAGGRIRDLERSLKELRAAHDRRGFELQRSQDQAGKLLQAVQDRDEAGLRKRLGLALDEIVRRAEKLAGRRFTAAEETHLRDGAGKGRPLTPTEADRMLEVSRRRQQEERRQRGSAWDRAAAARNRDDDLGPSR